MGRQINRLTARAAETISAPGRHADGGGLYLSVGLDGRRRWVFLYKFLGRQREAGLGSAAKGGVSLRQAREKAAEARAHIAAGVDPLAEWRKAALAQIPTFGEMADEVAAELSKGFRNAKHRAQWAMTLTVYAETLRAKPVDQIDTADVLAVLQPIWTKKAETASRLRGRIERVLAAAKAKGYRAGENPATWRGHLDTLLSKRLRLTRGHHTAMPYGAVPSFLARLREREAVAALGLEFCILTAARSGEVLGARWDEIDLEGRVWSVPGERMKAGRPHRVPLADRALEILGAAAKVKTGDYVFPGQRHGRPLSVMALDMVLRRMDIDATVHGFRSSFRDWAGNETAFPRELAEQALAHVIGDKAEQAYRRGDALERRRALMDAWGRYCAGAGGVVVTLRAGTAARP